MRAEHKLLNTCGFQILQENALKTLANNWRDIQTVYNIWPSKQCNCTINFPNFGILAADSYKLKLPLRWVLLRWQFYFHYHMNVRTLVVILLYVLAGLGYILKYQVTEKRGYSFENALIEKSKSSTRKKFA